MLDFFYLKLFPFLVVKFSIYLNRRIFVMLMILCTCTLCTCLIDFFVLGLNDTSSLVGNFVSFPREREKRDNRGDGREGQGRKRNRNESEETEEIIPPLPLTASRIAGLAQLEANIRWTPQ